MKAARLSYTQKFLRGLDQFLKRKDPTFRKLRNTTMIAVLMDTGIEPSELRYLRMQDLDPQHRWIHCGGTHYLLSPQTTALLTLYRNRRIGVALSQARVRDHLFLSRSGKPLPSGSISHIQELVLHRFGIEGSVLFWEG